MYYPCIFEINISFWRACRLMQPEGSETDSMADYNPSLQSDNTDVQERVQYVFRFVCISWFESKNFRLLSFS